MVPRLLLTLTALVFGTAAYCTEYCPPRDIIFMLQSSGIVNEDGWQQIQEFATGIIENELEADGTRVGVVVFSSDVYSFPLTTDFAAARDYIQNSVWLGDQTHLLDAFLTAIPMFDGTPPSNQKCIFLMAAGNNPPTGQDVCDQEKGLGIPDSLIANEITVGMVGAIEDWLPVRLECLVDDPKTQQQHMDAYFGLNSMFCALELIEATLTIDVDPAGLQAPWSFVGGPHGEFRSGFGADTPESVVFGDYVFTWEDVPGYDTPVPNPVDIALELGSNQILGVYLEASDVDETTDGVGFALAPGANPFGGATEIRFGLPEPGLIDLAIHDVAGRTLRELVSGEWTSAGTHIVAWDGRDDQGRQLPSGSYIARFTAGAHQSSKRMILVR